MQEDRLLVICTLIAGNLLMCYYLFVIYATGTGF